MADYSQLKSEVKKTVKPELKKAKLGYSFDGGKKFTVKVDGDSTMYWARYDNTFGRVRHRGRVGPAPHCPVWLEYEADDVLAIKYTNAELAKQYMGDSAGFVEGGLIPNNRFFGGSPLDLRMILQLELEVVSGLEIQFHKGAYNFEGVMYAWDGLQTIDLTSLLPDTDFYQRWAVVGIKTDVDPHEIYAVAGDQQSVGVDLTLEDLTTVANELFIANNYIPLDGVILRYNQEELAETDYEALLVPSVQINQQSDDTLHWLHWGF